MPAASKENIVNSLNELFKAHNQSITNLNVKYRNAGQFKTKTKVNELKLGQWKELLNQNYKLMILLTKLSYHAEAESDQFKQLLALGV